MRYVAAYLLGSLAGKDPSQAEIEKILGSVGIEAESTKLEKLFKELKGNNIDELMSRGMEKLASMPAGGGGTAITAAPDAATAAAPAVESKKEEKNKEDSESEDDDMGFGLFD